MLHVVHHAPGTGGAGTNLRVCEGTQNNWQKEQQQEQFIGTRIANCKKSKTIQNSIINAQLFTERQILRSR